MTQKIVPFIAILAMMIDFSGCAKRSALGPSERRGSSQAPNYGPVPPEHLKLFEEGFAAFREFTPEGYMRAFQLFGRAAELEPETCLYQLHRAQASLFLAYELQLNGDDSTTAFERGATPPCAAATSASSEAAFAVRLQAFRVLQQPNLTAFRVVALDAIEDALELEPDDPMSLYVQSRIGPRRGGIENDPLARALTIAPDLALIQYEAGIQMRNRRSLVDAENAFKRAIELSPRHFRSYVGLARTLLLQDDGDDVESVFKRAVEIAPTFIEGLFAFGDFYSSAVETELAAEQYLGALAHNPKLDEAHVKLAFLYLQGGRIDEAERAALSAIEVNASSHEAHYCLGNVWYERGDLERAQAEYERAIKIVQIYPEAMYGLGRVHFDKGRFDPAIEQFNLVIRYVPNHANAYFSRALIRGERKQTKEAIEDCDFAIRYYQVERDIAAASLQRAIARGLLRKADFEIKKMSRLDETMERVRKLKTTISYY